MNSEIARLMSLFGPGIVLPALSSIFSDKLTFGFRFANMSREEFMMIKIPIIKSKIVNNPPQDV